MNHLYFSATIGTYLSQKAFALDFCYGFGQELVSTMYSGIQWIRHRNSKSWKNHDANKQHGDVSLYSRNYFFVWVYILAIVENQQNQQTR